MHRKLGEWIIGSFPAWAKQWKYSWFDESASHLSEEWYRMGRSSRDGGNRGGGNSGW